MNADVSRWARRFEYRTRLRRSLAAGRKFADDRRGAVAVLIALAAVPLIGTIGIGVDSARGYIAQSRLSAAVDAAALAGGNSFFASTRDDDIKMIFHTNFPDGYLGASVDGPKITPTISIRRSRSRPARPFPSPSCGCSAMMP